jgi:hypothetical protein
METHYIGDCHHLFCNDIENNNCLKRYFVVNDYWHSFKQHRIAICNDYIRLKINEAIAKHDNKYLSNWDKKMIIYSVVEQEISSFLHVNDEFTIWHNNLNIGSSKSKFINKDIIIEICERPFIGINIDYKEFLMLFNNIENMEYQLSSNLKMGAVNFFIDRMDYIIRRVSLKTLHKEAEYLKNQLLKPYYQWDLPRMADFYCTALSKIN